LYYQLSIIRHDMETSGIRQPGLGDIKHQKSPASPKRKEGG
jgi:hypothetical protein